MLCSSLFCVVLLAFHVAGFRYVKHRTEEPVQFTTDPVEAPSPVEAGTGEEAKVPKEPETPLEKKPQAPEELVAAPSRTPMKAAATRCIDITGEYSSPGGIVDFRQRRTSNWGGCSSWGIAVVRGTNRDFNYYVRGTTSTVKITFVDGSTDTGDISGSGPYTIVLSSGIKMTPVIDITGEYSSLPKIGSGSGIVDFRQRSTSITGDGSWGIAVIRGTKQNFNYRVRGSTVTLDGPRFVFRDGSTDTGDISGSGPYTIVWSSGVKMTPVAAACVDITGEYSFGESANIAYFSQRGCIGIAVIRGTNQNLNYRVRGSTATMDFTNAGIILSFSAIPSLDPNFSNIETLTGDISGNGPYTIVWSSGATNTPVVPKESETPVKKEPQAPAELVVEKEPQAPRSAAGRTVASLTGLAVADVMAS